MDEEIYIDVDEQYAFGEEANDTDLIFTEYAASPRNQSATWQRIVEMKSAAHEGYLAYHIISERELEGLPVYAKSLFSVHSPIEQLTSNSDMFNSTVADRQTYIEHRQDILHKLDQLIMTAAKGSQVAMKLIEVKELLAMQLYGFGRAALQEDEVKLGLDAFRIAKVLTKKKVIDLLRDYLAENPGLEEEVKEYIHFHA